MIQRICLQDKNHKLNVFCLLFHISFFITLNLSIFQWRTWLMSHIYNRWKIKTGNMHKEHPATLQIDNTSQIYNRWKLIAVICIKNILLPVIHMTSCKYFSRLITRRFNIQNFDHVTYTGFCTTIEEPKHQKLKG